jgi:hypothetical protein
MAVISSVPARICGVSKQARDRHHQIRPMTIAASPLRRIDFRIGDATGRLCFRGRGRTFWHHFNGERSADALVGWGTGEGNVGTLIKSGDASTARYKKAYR